MVLHLALKVTGTAETLPWAYYMPSQVVHNGPYLDYSVDLEDID